MLARRLHLALCVALLLAAGPARAQLLPPIEGGAVVPGVNPPDGGPADGFSLASIRPLSFGKFVAGSGGSVTIAPNGARSRSGGVILINSAGAGSAGFNVAQLKGGTNKSVVMSLPANGTVSISSGASSMSLANFINDSGTVLPLTPAGLILNIGATLTVAPNQAPGTYSGTFNLTVNYQ